MKLNFDETGTAKHRLGSSIVFTDYPNKNYTVEMDGFYIAVVYANGDTIYLHHKNDEYWVWKIHTHDDLTFTYEK